jgi:hypothetical protein
MTDTNGEFAWNEQPIVLNKCCRCFMFWKLNKKSLGIRNRVRYSDNDIDKIDKDGEIYTIGVKATNINNKESPIITIGKYLSYNSLKQAYLKLSREKILELVSAEIKGEIHPLHRLIVKIIVSPKQKIKKQLSFSEGNTLELVIEQSTPNKIKKVISNRFIKKMEKQEDPTDFGIDIEKEMNQCD